MFPLWGKFTSRIKNIFCPDNAGLKVPAVNSNSHISLLWQKIPAQKIEQGLYLPRFKMVEPDHASILPAYLKVGVEAPDEVEIGGDLVEGNFIVLTQTCDIVNSKTSWIVVCPVLEVSDFRPDFAKQNPGKQFGKNRFKDVWDKKEKGYYLIPNPEDEADFEKALIVMQRQAITLPIEHVKRYLSANNNQTSWALKSPYLEDFSQSFGALYMRVALMEWPLTFKKNIH